MACLITYRDKEFATTGDLIAYAKKHGETQLLYSMAPEFKNAARSATISWFYRLGLNRHKIAEGANVHPAGLPVYMNRWNMLSQGEKDITMSRRSFEVGVQLMKNGARDIYRELFNFIGETDAYKTTLATLRKNPKYLREDGYINIVAIKDRAIAQILYNLYNNTPAFQEETAMNARKTQGHYNAVKARVKRMYDTMGFDPFQVALDETSEMFDDKLAVGPSLTQEDLKPEYRNKIVWANPGMGKSFLANGKDIIDTDNLLSEELNTPVQNIRWRMKEISEKDRKAVESRVRQRALELKAGGATIVTGAMFMIEDADVAVMNSNPYIYNRRISSKTKANPYRLDASKVNTTIGEFKHEIANSNVPLVEVVEDETLSDVVVIAPKHEKTTIELKKSKKAANEKLDKFLLDFLAQFGVQAVQFEDFKAKYGVDALGSSDILNKLVRYSSKKNYDTIPEEAAHFITMLMGYRHPTIDHLRKNIRQWSGFKEVFDEYMPIYKNMDAVVFEAIGKLITKGLQRRFEEKEKNLFQQAIDAIKRWILKEFSVNYAYSFEQTAYQIATEVMAGNNSIIDRFKRKSETPLNYQEAISTNPHAVTILDEVDKRFGESSALVGSLAIAKQGERIYRPSDEQIHDLDFTVSKFEGNKQDLDNFMASKNAIPTNVIGTIEDDPYITYSFLWPKEGFRVEKTGVDKYGGVNAVKIWNEKGELIHDGLIKDADKTQVMLVDFFLYHTFSAEKRVEGVASWQDVHLGKVAMSWKGNAARWYMRVKDQQDYVEHDPINREGDFPSLTYFQTDPNAPLPPTAPANAYPTEGKRLFDIAKSHNGVSIAKYEDDPITGVKRHYLINGLLQITKSVTDRTKEFYERVKGEFSESEYIKLSRELVAEAGVEGHKDIEHIVKLIMDEETGLLVPNPQRDPTHIPFTNDIIYEKLFQYIHKKMHSFPKGTRFLSEVYVYDDIEKEAGTIDFMAITEDGTATILDWKFQNLYNQKDVPWYKKQANNIQLKRYKEIATQNYGIHKWSNDTAAIPIAATYTRSQLFHTRGDMNFYPVMTDITIGDANVQNIVETHLLPVLLDTASTGDAEVDKMVAKLKAAEAVLVEQMRGARTEQKILSLRNQISLLNKAIRHLQLQKSLIPLLDNAKDFLDRIGLITQEYKNTIEGKEFRTNRQEFEDFAVRIERAFTELNIYRELSSSTQHLFASEDDPTYQRVLQVTNAATILRNKILNVNNSLNSQMGWSFGIKNMLSAELSVKMLERFFKKTSRLPTAALRLFYQLRNQAKQEADLRTNDENLELIEIQERYIPWAQGKGYTSKNFFALLTQGGKNKLLNQYKQEFYDQARDATQKRDSKWLRANVDLVKLQAELDKQHQYEKEILDSIDRKMLTEDKLIDLEYDYLNLAEKFSIEEDDSLGWSQYKCVKLAPLESWTTEQYLELHAAGNEPARDFYRWIIRMNEKAYEAGYLPQGVAARTFLPFAPESLMEKLVSGNVRKSLTDSFWLSLTIDENSVGKGQIDQATGRPKQKIPVYLVNELKEGHSSNLFKSMGLYNQFVNEYKSLSEIEGLCKSIGRMEENKRSLQTDVIGRPIKEHGTVLDQVSNEQNASLYWNQMRALVYGDKYVNSDRFDVMLGEVAPILGKMNKYIGRKFYPENLTGRQLSLNKAIEAINNWAQMKAIGVNPMTAGVNFMGGNFQVIASAGRWFTRKEFIRGEVDLLMNHISGKDGEKFVAACRYFLPFTENANRELLKKLSGTWTDATTMQDMLMIMMRTGDRGIQASVFNALLKNMIVVDGEFKNARVYYLESPEYRARYAPGTSHEQRKVLEDGFEAKVADLIAKHGVLNSATVDAKGNLVVPGIERNAESIRAMRNLTQELSEKATGGMSDDEIRGYQQSIYTKSMMIYKNWIPSLASMRYAKLQYSDRTQSYEWGRMRTFYSILAQDHIKAINTFLQVAKCTDEGLRRMDVMYLKKKADHLKDTGKELEITKEEFYDLMRNNVRTAAKDVILTSTLLIMWLLAKQLPPDDDEDPMVKSWYNFMMKAIDKVLDEMLFFYSPKSADGMLNGNIFPTFSVLTDSLKLMGAFGAEIFGLIFKDDKWVDDNKVIKYVMKSFPVTSQISTWIPLFAPEAAKDMGLRISPEARPRH